jgi:hypothetical protein
MTRMNKLRFQPQRPTSVRRFSNFLEDGIHTNLLTQMGQDTPLPRSDPLRLMGLNPFGP